jgi:hypothetical protein
MIAESRQPTQLATAKGGNVMLDNDIFYKQSSLAFWSRVLNWLMHKGNDLPEYSQVIRERAFTNQRDLGVQIVPVNRIVGTVGRGRDFDRGFRPRREDMRERWMRIQRLFERQGQFPVLELYKLGDLYFVVDGHHRVSVARANHVSYVDARVVEIHTAPKGPAYAC